MNPYNAIQLSQLAKQNARLALAEDLGLTALDQITIQADISATLIESETRATATIICRENAVLCGIPWVNAVFDLLAADTTLEWHYADGDKVKADTKICTLNGNHKVLLTGERSALNFLQTLSATATSTQAFVQQLSNSQTKILDTRKTIPGLRYAQKYAVFCGGGHNHRFGLYDAILLKENHIIAAGSITKAIVSARKQHPNKLLEIEVENLEELKQALTAGADRILLDNFSEQMLTQAIAIASNYKTALEVSGNITMATIANMSKLGIDYISIGALTKHIKAIDFSMRFNNTSA